MVSPRSQRSRPSVDDIEESNSTASLFLGGVRRAWMPGASVPGLPPPQICDTQPMLAVADPPANSRPLNTLSSKQGRPEAALISPMTPGANLQPSASLVDKPDAPTAALPSPAPSNNSNPSPIIAPNTPRDAAFLVSDRPPVAVPQNAQNAQNAVHPSQPATVPQQNPTITTSTNSCGQESPHPRQSLPRLTNSLPVQSPVTDQTPGQGPSLMTDGHGNTPQNTGPEPQLSQRDTIRTQPSGLTMPGDDIWAQWKASLRDLKQAARVCPSPIAQPRVRLLEDACEYKDLLYLVLHQVYCLQYLDNQSPSELPPLRDFLVLREKACQEGMLRVQELIEPNTRMPAPMVWRLAGFPGTFEALSCQNWYFSTVQAISLCLTRIATHFTDHKASPYELVYHRGYPPTIDELRGLLHATSPVLMTVMFISTCRTFYGAESMTKLTELFRQDLQASLQGKNSTVMQEYKKIPMRPRPTPLTVPLSQPTPSASPSCPFQDIPDRVAQVPSSGSPVVSVHSNSPVISIHSSPHSGQNSPRGSTNVNVPVSQSLSGQQTVQAVNQHSPYPQQPVQQRQTIVGQPPQLNRVWYQGQWRQYDSVQMQLPPQSQAQPGHYCPTPTAYQGPVQQSPRVQMQQPAQVGVPSNFPSLTSNPSQPQSQPLPPHLWYGQMPPQPHHPPARSHGNTPQRDHIQGLPIQQVPSSATRRPPKPSSRPPLNVPLLPPPGHRLPHTVNPSSMRMALHQADLRDPEKRLGEVGPNKEWVELELFQHLGNFILRPQIIDPKKLRYDWDFQVPETECKRFPHLQERGGGKRHFQTIQPGCSIFRLRFITLRPFEQDNVERLWSTKNPVWPSVLYIFVNGTELYVRRKAHHGKDIPLEISRLVRPGNNTVTIHLLLEPGECKDFKYAVGIEDMQIQKFERVRDLVGITPAEQTRQNIQKRLTPSVDSDDLAVVTDSLTISLIDPFMAQIFKSPVRSENCDHLECFDHETFIQTRKSVSGVTPMNDNWRCPICNVDARPQLLRVDKFFTEVRDQLVATHQLEGTQAIQVKADGTWTVQVMRHDSPNDRPSGPATGKRKADDVEGGSDTSRTKFESSPPRRTTLKSTEPIVIELD